jgi:hypothetical protein
MRFGKKSSEHNIVSMDHRTIHCKCGWMRDLRGQDWGTSAGKDRLLDLYNIHKKAMEAQ